jgi:hypothetical protein
VSLIPVKFIAKYAPYNANEIAGFEDNEAARLVEKGLAVYLSDEAQEAADGEQEAGPVGSKQGQEAGEGEAAEGDGSAEGSGSEGQEEGQVEKPKRGRK